MPETKEYSEQQKEVLRKQLADARIHLKHNHATIRSLRIQNKNILKSIQTIRRNIGE